MEYTPIKVRKGSITCENSTNKSIKKENRSGTKDTKKTERKKSEFISKDLLYQEDTKYKYSGDSLKGVELNKTFFSIIKNKIISNKKITGDKLYFQNEICKKFCGEKLFKTLDLNQRFYLKKTGEAIIHNQGCPLYMKKANPIRNKSVPMTHREQRKNSIEKDYTLLNLSLAVVKGNSIKTPSQTPKASSTINDNSNKIPFLGKDIPTKTLQIGKQNIQVKKNHNNNYENSNENFIKFVEYNKLQNRTIVIYFEFIFTRKHVYHNLLDIILFYLV